MAEEWRGDLTCRQQEVLKLRQEGRSIREIAAALKIAPSIVHRHLKAAERKCQEQEELAQLMEEVPGGTAKTANELRVLALVGKGMTVKQAASYLGKTEASVRLTLHRNGLSAKDFAKKQLCSAEAGCRNSEQEIPGHGKYEPPVLKEARVLEDPELIRMYVLYRQGEVGAEAELVLRAYGLIKYTPLINRNNRVFRRVLQELAAGRVVLHLRRSEVKLLRSALGKCGIAWQRFFGAKLLGIDRASGTKLCIPTKSSSQSSPNRPVVPVQSVQPVREFVHLFQ